MEEVFGIAPPAAAKKESKGAPAAAKGKAEKNIALIDVKRSNNVAIAMARLRLPDGEIKARVCDGPPLSLEQVSALLSASLSVQLWPRLSVQPLMHPPA